MDSLDKTFIDVDDLAKKIEARIKELELQEKEENSKNEEYFNKETEENMADLESIIKEIDARIAEYEKEEQQKQEVPELDIEDLTRKINERLAELDEIEEDDLGKTISYEDFYTRMDNGAITKTSQVNVEDYVDHFKKILEEGKDIIHLCLSSGLSGTINSALMAKEMLLKEFPERRIEIIDSLAASSGFGLLTDDLCDLRDAGVSIDEAVKTIEEIKLNVRHWFFSTTLKFYVRGGRVSRLSGTIGNILHICPLLDVSNKGKLIVREKIISKKKVIKRISEKVVEDAENGANYQGKCFISNSGCKEDAEVVKNLIEEKVPALKGKIKMFDIGTIIGAHSGRGTVAVFYHGTKRIK